MASGPTWNPRRGTWYVQWHDGKTWKRKTVTKPPVNWRPGMVLLEPKKVPPEAIAGRAEYDRKEKEARERKEIGMPTSLAVFLDEHVKTYHRDSSRKSVQTTVKQFLGWCQLNGVETVPDVTPAAAGAWMDSLAGIRRLATVQRIKAQLSKAWRKLKKRSGIPNPWESVDVIGLPGKGAKGSWTKEEYARLYEEAPNWLKDVLTFGTNTGLRIEAIMKIEWDDWIRPAKTDRHFGHLRVRPELDKIHRGYTVPVSPELNKMLRKRDELHKHKFILTGHHGLPLKSRTVTFRGIVRACEKAGLPKPLSPNHHMRRTFGRWAHFGYLTGTPVPLYVVSRWLGHTSTKMTLEYLDLKEEDSTWFMVGDGFPSQDAHSDSLGHFPVSRKAT